MVDFIDTDFTVVSNEDEIKYIEYEYMQLLCSDGSMLRYPAYSETQLAILMAANDKRLDPTAFEGVPISETGVGGNALNFTLSGSSASNFTPNSGVILQQVLQKDSKDVTCAFNIKILNNYLKQIAEGDQQNHINEGETDHEILIGLYSDDQQFLCLAGGLENGLTLAEAIYARFGN